MQPQELQQTREDFVKSLFVLESQDNIHDGNEGRKKLIKGIDKVVDAIKVSYGSAGSNVIIESDLYPFTKTVNDGKAIAESIKLANPVENMGANIAKETADKSDRISGDGRKTSLILLQAILKEGVKSKESPMELKRSLDECLEIIHKSIDDQTKEISPLDVGSIATIASESESLGATFQEIYTQIGKDGIVELDNSNLPETFYELTEGVKLHGAGFTYPYMANDEKCRTAVFNSPKVLITKQKITSVVELDAIFKALSKQGINELVIFCDDIDVKISQMIAQVHMQGIFKTLVIKAPTLWKDWLFEDFAKITGATIINPAEGTSLKSFSMSWLGTCGKITSTKEETVVLGIKDISDHLSVLEEENTDEAKIRASRLQTKTAVLKLGANSETELSYIRGKALDARNSSYLAMQHGVVAGGGKALFNTVKSLPNTMGGNILKVALEAPLRQIVENSEAKITYNFVDENRGFDSKSGKVVDMYKAGILDSSIVVKNAVQNALSVASTILTSRVIITKTK